MELPDLNIYTKPLNEMEKKYIHMEHCKILNEDLSQINDYTSLGNTIRYSMSTTLNRIPRERRHQSVKKLRGKADMATSTTPEDFSFNSLLQDPMKIDRIISALVTLKNEIISKDLLRIKNPLLGAELMNKLQDFSGKCMKVIKRQHEIIRRLSSLSLSVKNSPMQTIDKDALSFKKNRTNENLAKDSAGVNNEYNSASKDYYEQLATKLRGKFDFSKNLL